MKPMLTLRPQLEAMTDFELTTVCNTLGRAAPGTKANVMLFGRPSTETAASRCIRSLYLAASAEQHRRSGDPQHNAFRVIDPNGWYPQEIVGGLLFVQTITSRMSPTNTPDAVRELFSVVQTHLSTTIDDESE